jgi:hypothetical protein
VVIAAVSVAFARRYPQARYVEASPVALEVEST